MFKRNLISTILLLTLPLISASAVAVESGNNSSTGNSDSNNNAVPTPADGKDVQFDLETLKSRGIDPSLANYFSEQAKFIEGDKAVTVSVNGHAKGSIPVRFNNKGQACLSEGFLKAAGLKIPDTSDATDGCYDYAKAYPGTVLTLIPNEERVDIVTPPDAIAPLAEQGVENALTGGTAALLNYSMFTSSNEFEGGKSTYSQGSFETGFNFHDWLIRSSNMVTQSDGVFSHNSLYTYAQHTLTDYKKVLQVGEININNSLFSGDAISGVQLFPEAALDINNNNNVVVTGIAQTPQARVEVRQSGSLIYSTLVPAGPFTLTNIPIISGNIDLDVKVVETSGSINTFRVPAQSFGGSGIPAAQGLSMAMGRTRDTESPYGDPWLATVSDGWALTRNMNLSAGALAADQYNSLASGLDIAVSKDLTFGAKVLTSSDKRSGNKGQQLQMSANYRAPWSLTFGASATQNSRGFRTLSDSLRDEEDSGLNKSDYSLNVGWSETTLGSFSLGLTKSEGFDKDDNSSRISASWGRHFKYALVNVSWQHELDSDSGKHHHEDGYDGDYSNFNNDGDTWYVNVSIPFGGQTVNTYVRNDGDSTTYGAQTSGNISKDTSYNITAESGQNESDRNIYAGINSNLHYTRVGLNAGTNGDKSRNYSASLDGAIVAHSHGVTFSPYAVDDTFAIASLSEEVAGVEIGTSQGPVWTDKWGQAVIPSLTPYKDSVVTVNTETLPKNLDVVNGYKSVNAGHGSVPKMQFGAASVRRLMLATTMPDGKPIEKGVAIFDDKGQYVTTAVDDGVVFLDNAAEQTHLIAQLDESHRCRINFKANEKTDLDNFYENVTAKCEPM
ncbi:fimbrial biogenesis usher protein [Buttiauxella sp.]|uniref:fimbrial biogenesis usher protein n=1 Tax=Buttiauxella sp. TaxID=1972222 RepID=UPI003C74FD0D